MTGQEHTHRWLDFFSEQWKNGWSGEEKVPFLKLVEEAQRHFDDDGIEDQDVGPWTDLINCMDLNADGAAISLSVKKCVECKIALELGGGYLCNLADRFFTSDEMGSVAAWTMTEPDADKALEILGKSVDETGFRRGFRRAMEVKEVTDGEWKKPGLDDNILDAIAEFEANYPDK